MYPPPFAEFNHVHWSRWYSDNHLVDIIFSRMKFSTTSAMFNTCRTWLLYCILCVYKCTREHNQPIMTTSITNEYTSLYKSLTLYFRKGDVCCVWEMSEDKDRLLYWPKFFFTHSSTSFASWFGLLNRGSLKAQSPLSAACSHFSILSPTDSNHLSTCLYYFLMPTCFRCSSAYLHRCISWLTARSRVNI